MPGRMLAEPSWVEMARAGLRFYCAQHDQGRPARPFLARRPAALSRPGLRFRQHDPRGAGAVRGDRAGRLSRARARLAAGVRRKLRQSGQRRLLPDRVRRRGPGGSSGLDQRRRHAQSEFHRRAKPGAARGADRRRQMARAGRPAVRRRAGGRRRSPVPARGAAQRARPAPACGRDRGHRPGARALRRRGAQAAVLSRIVLRAPSAGALPANHPAQAKIAAGRGARRSSAWDETCSLPVTDPDKIADAVGAMRPTTAA